RVGQGDPRAAAATGRHRAGRLPGPTALRQRDLVPPREVARVPLEREPAELAPPSEVQHQVLPLSLRGIARPGAWRRQRSSLGREGLELEAVDPERPLAARRRGHRDLDESELAQGRLSVAGPPRELDAALRIAHRRPLARKREVALDGPPDV